MLRLSFTILFILIKCISFAQCEGKLTDTIYKKQGEFYIYPKYEDTVKTILPFACPLRDGKWKAFYADSVTLLATFIIKEHKMEGTLKYYHRRKFLSGKIKIKNNMRHGKSIFYHYNGKMSLKSKWRDGKMNGKWIFYNSEGKAYHIKHYKNNKLIKEHLYLLNIPVEYYGMYRDRN